MKIAEERQSSVVVLKPEGNLDSTGSPDLEAALLSVIDRGETRMVVDLSGVSYITSSGLRVLLLGYKKLQAAAGGFAVCSLHDVVNKVFDVAGFREVLSVFDDAAQAVEALSGEAAS